MNNALLIAAAVISGLFLCSCSERINVYVYSDSGDPIRGAVVVHTGQEEIQQIATNENGMASMEKNQDRAGVYRVSVEFMNVAHEARIVNVSEIQMVILSIGSDTW